MRLAFNFSMFFVFLATLGIAIERCIATMSYLTYEKNRRAGPLIALIQVLLVILLLVPLYRRSDFSHPIVYCMQITPATLNLAVIPFGSLAFLQILAILILWALQNVNKVLLNKQRLKPNLITRYNIDENIRTLAIVMPFCLASCIFGSLFIATDAVILLFNYTFESFATLYAVLDGSLLLPEYAFVLPPIVNYMAKKVAETNRQSLQRQVSRKSPGSQGDLYFTSLTSSWNQPYSRAKVSSWNVVCAFSKKAR